MLRRLPKQPDFHDVDRVLEQAGSVLDAMEATYREQVPGWRPSRRRLASRSIHLAFDAVNTAIHTLVIDRDVDGAVERLTDALPLLRRAWAVQTLRTV
jgi:hypothetical protein